MSRPRSLGPFEVLALHRRYWDDHVPAVRLAEEAGCSRPTLYNSFRRHDLPVRSSREGLQVASQAGRMGPRRPPSPVP